MIRAYYRGVRLSNAFIIGFAGFLLILGIVLYYFFFSPLTYGSIAVIFSFGMAQLLISSVRFIRSFREYNEAIIWFQESPEILKKHEVPKLEKRNQQINWARKL